MAARLAEVAELRRAYNAGVDEIRRLVMEAARSGAAVVETPHRPGKTASALEDDHLSLTIPEPPKPAVSKPKSKPRRRRGPPPPDARQLELIARGIPKGDA